MAVPTIQELQDALTDINDLESFVNDAVAADITTRLGTVYPNLTKIANTVISLMNFLADDGTVSSPSYSFALDDDTGIYRVTTNRVGIACGGVQAIQMSSSAVIPALPVTNVDGSVTTPGYTFTLDSNTGMYRPASGQIAFSSNGTQAFIIDSATKAIIGTGAGASDNATLELIGGATGFSTINLGDSADNNVGQIQYDHTNNDLGFVTGGAERLIIDSSGINVTSGDLTLQSGKINYSSAINGTLNTPASFRINIDSDNNSTSEKFTIGKNQDSASSGNELLTVGESGQITATSGTAAAPTYSFISDTNTGIFNTGVDQLGLTAAGIERFQVNSSEVRCRERLVIVAGSESDPGLKFNGDTDTGFFNPGADQLNCSTGGSTRFTVSTSYFHLQNSLFRNYTNSAIIASTTQTQGNGALTASVNEVSTVANTNDTVTLPTAAAGVEVLIINNGANTLQIFPASGDNLGAGVNNSTTLAAGSNVKYVAYDSTNWVSI